MADFTIRPAQPEDAEAALCLAASVRGATYKTLIPAEQRTDFMGILKVNQGNIEKWRRKIEKSILRPDKNITKVLVKSDKVVGFYGARIQNGLLHIQNLYIDQALQGRGLGGRLLNEGINATPDLAVELYVLAKNKGAIAFYEQNGFRVVGKYDKKFYGAPRYIMKQG